MRRKEDGNMTKFEKEIKELLEEHTRLAEKVAKHAVALFEDGFEEEIAAKELRTSLELLRTEVNRHKTPKELEELGVTKHLLRMCGELNTVDLLLNTDDRRAGHIRSFVRGITGATCV